MPDDDYHDPAYVIDRLRHHVNAAGVYYDRGDNDGAEHELHHARDVINLVLDVDEHDDIVDDDCCCDAGANFGCHDASCPTIAVYDASADDIASVDVDDVVAGTVNVDLDQLRRNYIDALALHDVATHITARETRAALYAALHRRGR
jgi:hypothetical protein